MSEQHAGASMSGDPRLRATRLAYCVECERPFPQPVSEEQARADWGDAADDEIAYACESCGEDFEHGEDRYGR